MQSYCMTSGYVLNKLRVRVQTLRAPYGREKPVLPARVYCSPKVIYHICVRVSANRKVSGGRIAFSSSWVIWASQPKNLFCPNIFLPAQNRPRRVISRSSRAPSACSCMMPSNSIPQLEEGEDSITINRLLLAELQKLNGLLSQMQNDKALGTNATANKDKDERRKFASHVVDINEVRA